MYIIRFIRRAIWKIKATHWIYLALHFVLLVIGLLLVISGSTLRDPTRNTIIISLGGSIIATAIAGWVLFLYVWLSQDESRRMEIIRKFGLIEAFESRAVRIKAEYDTRLDHVSEAIDIMGFGLRAFNEDYHHDFAKWAARANVRILLLDPEFPSPKCSFADQRDKEENNDLGDIRRDVHSFIRGCAELLRNRDFRFEIKLYRCLPSINIFRIDDNLFWGPYLIGDVSRNFPTFVLNQQGTLYKRLLDHFDGIWNNPEFSRPVPIEWFESNETKGNS